MEADQVMTRSGRERSEECGKMMMLVVVVKKVRERRRDARIEMRTEVVMDWRGFVVMMVGVVDSVASASASRRTR